MIYRTEIKGIQEWIVGTGTLREIAGGSEVIERLIKRLKGDAEKCNGRVRFAAAGGATIDFDTRADVERFACWWPMIVDTYAPGVRMVQAWVDDERETELYTRLSEAANRVVPSLPEAGPLLSRTGRSGLPAVGRGRDGMLDRSMKARLDAYGSGSRRFEEQLLSGRPDSPSFIDETDQFPEGYVAVIHADGNGIGQRFVEGTVKDEASFSKALAEATLAAARTAIAEVATDRHGRVPVRPIVLGGDDFTIITPATVALTVARTFLQSFESETQARKEILSSGLTACAGIAIVKKGWPFVDAHKLAEGLCKGAKGDLRTRNLSGIAFHRVTTAIADDWETVRDGTLRAAAEAGIHAPGIAEVGDGGDSASRQPQFRRLTANPYRLSQLALLEELATAAAAMPRGALRKWVDLARFSLQAAQEHWDRMRENRKDTEELRRFDDALAALDAARTTGWIDERCTPILDCLELIRIKGRGSAPEAN